MGLWGGPKEPNVGTMPNARITSRLGASGLRLGLWSRV